jgi:hypothetical protein
VWSDRLVASPKNFGKSADRNFLLRRWRIDGSVREVWTITYDGLEGRAEDLQAVFSEDRTVSRELLSSLTFEADRLDTGLIRRLRVDLEGGAVSGDSVPGLTALESYAEEAAGGYRGSGILEPLGQGLAWTPHGGPATIAWHERTVVLSLIPANAQSVTLIYEPELEDDGTDPLYTGQIPWRLLDYRLYVGEHSSTVDGESWFHRFGPRRWVATISHAASVPALLVGRVVRWLGPPQTVHHNDESWRSRVESLERRFSVAAQRFPVVGSAPVQDSRVCVYVHGTRSCCLPALEQLREVLGEASVVRFEHDTFLSIEQNTTDLCDAIRRSVNTNRLLLVGHSRGGLVARLAGADLRTTTPDVDVMTFGTPHNGTPLVGRALELAFGAWGVPARLGLICELDEITDENGSPYTDPVSAALSVLTRSNSLPDGIRAMARESEFLRMLGRVDHFQSLLPFGGACTLADAQGGFRTSVDYQLAAGIFAGEQNDLVVGLASSSLEQRGIVLDAPCSHGAYFRDLQVRARLAAAL